MLSKPLFKEMFLVLVLIGVTHVLGVIYFWYWKFAWLDILMHFLGGLWVGLSAILIASFFIKRSDSVSRTNIILLAVVTAIFVGILWEIFEYVYGISIASRTVFIRDTTADMIMDTLGGFIAGIYGYRITKQFFRESFVSVSTSSEITAVYEK